MEKLLIKKDSVTDITYIQSNVLDKDLERDFTKDLLEYFFKKVLFDKIVFIFISFKNDMTKLSYTLLDVDVDNIHGYTIPFSELDDIDLAYVSVLGLSSVDSALKWLNKNLVYSLKELDSVKICYELPMDNVSDRIPLEELINRTRRLCLGNCEIYIGSKNGEF